MPPGQIIVFFLNVDETHGIDSKNTKICLVKNPQNCKQRIKDICQNVNVSYPFKLKYFAKFISRYIQHETAVMYYFWFLHKVLFKESNILKVLRLFRLSGPEKIIIYSVKFKPRLLVSTCKGSEEKKLARDNWLPYSYFST